MCPWQGWPTVAEMQLFLAALELGNYIKLNCFKIQKINKQFLSVFRGDEPHLNGNLALDWSFTRSAHSQGDTGQPSVSN